MAKKKKNKKTSPKMRKKLKKEVAAAPKPKLAAKKKPAPEPMVAPVVLPMPQISAPTIEVSYEMVARRAFLIWERKTHTNYPEQNWREAEAELRAELLATKT